MLPMVLGKNGLWEIICGVRKKEDNGCSNGKIKQKPFSFG